MQSKRSILMNFESEHDLLHGISLLQSNQVAISELYLPHKVAGLHRLLRIREIRRGSHVLRFGCLGGAAITTLLYYIVWQTPFQGLNISALPSILVNLSLMGLTYWAATALFPSKAPKLRRLPKGDWRYLVVISTDGLVVQGQLSELLNYAQAIELSPALKNMITA